MKNTAEWLRKYWFLITVFFSISVAYGQGTLKIQTLEETVKQHSETQKEIKEMRIQLSRTEERTQALVESQSRQERMIEMLLNNQQRTSQGLRAVNVR